MISSTWGVYEKLPKLIRKVEFFTKTSLKNAWNSKKNSKKTKAQKFSDLCMATRAVLKFCKHWVKIGIETQTDNF